VALAVLARSWRGKYHLHGEPAARVQLHLRSCVMGGDYRADDGKPEPVPVRVCRLVTSDSLEWLEEPLGLISGHHRACVGHRQNAVPATGFREQVQAGPVG
jgi:hypothetical protein